MLKAQAVVFVAPYRVELCEIDVPEPVEGEVLVMTSRSGISAGTEMLAYRGEVDAGLALDETIGALGGTFRYPFRYGYSCAGYVDGLARDLEDGALVFAYQPHQSCFCAQAGDLVPMGEVPPRTATLFPLVETALQIALDTGAVLGQTIVIVGLGAVGLLTGSILTRAGARVIGSEPLPCRRAVAPAFGIGAVEPVDLPSAVRETTDGAGVPVVIEASGNPSVLASCLPLLAHEGVVLVASWYGTKAAMLPLGGEFHRRRLAIRSTQVSTIPAGLLAHWSIARRRATALGLMSQLPLDLLSSHEFSVADAASAYSAVDRGEAGLLHAALRYA